MPDWINPHDHRRELDSEVFEVVAELYAAGWRFTTQGHGWRGYCPCLREAGGRSVAIGGTPKNPGNAARRLRRQAEKCPDLHDLM